MKYFLETVGVFLTGFVAILGFGMCIRYVMEQVPFYGLLIVGVMGISMMLLGAFLEE